MKRFSFANLLGARRAEEGGDEKPADERDDEEEVEDEEAEAAPEEGTEDEEGDGAGNDEEASAKSASVVQKARSAERTRVATILAAAGEGQQVFAADLALNPQGGKYLSADAAVAVLKGAAAKQTGGNGRGALARAMVEHAPPSLSPSVGGAAPGGTRTAGLSAAVKARAETLGKSHR